MPNYAVQISLNPKNGLSADRYTNSWSCEATGVSGANDFATDVIALYRQLTTYLPDLVALDKHLVKVYDRSDPIPRSPVIEDNFTLLTTPAGAPLPPEVCVCISFQGDPESGVSQARKRGRIYFGPLDQTQIEADGRPLTNMVNAMRTAALDLLDKSAAANNYTWTVYSASTGDSFPVTNGWVDNEYDIQRRRGRIATARAVF
jgi:hypothetical protein